MIVQRLSHLKDWYERNERRVSILSLVGGFIFDSLTLQRIDSLLDNVWLAANLISVGACIILLHRHESSPRRHFWLFNIMQFNFGALLGASFIFYFRSAALAVSWPFLLILLAAMFANEFLKHHYDRLIFQISLFYLALFIYFSYLVPVVVHQIGPATFLLSGVLSLVILWVFAKTLKEFSRGAAVFVASIFIIMNVLYFTNIIPPIPLVLKNAGIYHSISRTASGNYVVAEEKREWFDALRTNQRVNWVPGDSLYAFSAVFSPTDLDTSIVHEWQYKDESGKWITTTRIPLKLFGGRAEGFRTYSVKSNLKEGLWRVNVVTARGAIIGRINFRIVKSSTRPLVDFVIKR